MADVMLKLRVSADGQGNLTAVAQGLEKVEGSAKKAQASLDGLGKQFAAGLGISAGMMSVEALVSGLKSVVSETAKAIKETAAYAEKMKMLSDTTAISVETLQKYDRIARNVGISNEAIAKGVVKVQVAIANGSKAIERMGLSYDALKAMRPDEQFAAVSKALMSIPDAAQRSATATEIFGRAWLDLAPAIRAVAGETENWLVLSDGQIERMASMDQGLDDMEAAWKAIKDQMSAAIVEATGLDGTLKALAATLEGIGKKESTGAAGTTVYALGAIAAKLSGITSMVQGSRVLGLLARFTDIGVNGMGENPAVTNSIFDGQSINIQPPTTAELEREKQLGQIREDRLSKEAAYQKTISELLARSAASARILYLQMGSGVNKNLTSYLGPTKNIYGMSGDTNYDFGGNYLGDKIDPVAAAIKRAAQETVAWQAGLQGVALLAGSIGGKFGDVAQVIGNIGQSFAPRYDANGKRIAMSGYDKFNAIASGVGQIGGLIGGTAGSAISGAAGGAMTGAAIGSMFGPGYGTVIGGAIGGVVGLVGGIWGSKKKEKEQLEEAMRQINTLIKEQFGSFRDAEREAAKYGVTLTKATDKKSTEALTKQLDDLARRMKGTQMAMDGLMQMFSSLSYEKDGKMFDTFSDPAVADAMAQSFGSIFWATWKRLGIAAVDQLRPAWEQLHKMFSSAELTNMGFGSIGKLMDATNDPRTRALLNFSQGGAQLMTGAIDAGYMSDQLLADQTTLARMTLTELQGQGLDANAMADQLVALAKSYEATGQALPEDLKKAMEDAGIKVLDSQLEVLKDIRSLLGGGEPSNTGGKSSDPYNPNDFESAAVGYGPRKLDKDTMFLAHQGEHVLIIPRGQKVGFKSAMRGFPENDGDGGYGGGGGVYIPPTPTPTPTTSTGTSSNTTDDFTTSADSSGVRTTQSTQSAQNQIIVSPTINASAYHDAQTRQELSRFVVDELVSQIRNNPTLRRELRDVR